MSCADKVALQDRLADIIEGNGPLEDCPSKPMEASLDSVHAQNIDGFLEKRRLS
jgi:hypothetical protein